MKSLITMLCATYVLTAIPVAAEKQEPPAKLSIDEAVALIGDNDLMYKDRVAQKKSTAAAAAFKDLPEKEARQAVEKLLPLLPTARGHALNALKAALTELGDAPIQPLIDEISNDDRWQTAGTTALHLYKDKVLPQITALLGQRKPEMRRRAAIVLRGILGKPTWFVNQRDAGEILAPMATALGEQLKNKNAEVAIESAQTLIQMRKHSEPALDNLIAALTAKNTGLRKCAVTALGELGNGAAPAIPELVAALNDPEQDVRQEIYRVLPNLGEPIPVVVALVDGLQDEVKPVRLQAVESLGKVGPKVTRSVAMELVKMLGDPAEDVRAPASRSLASIGKEAVPELVTALERGPAIQRRFAAYTLAKIGPDAAAAIKPLQTTLRHGDPMLRINSAEALGRIGDKSAVPALLPVLNDRTVLIALAAAEALKALAADDEKVNAALKTFADRLAAANKSTPDPSPGTEGKEDDYLIGGPLAGIPLPLFPTQHGEPAGHPGCIPALTEKALAEKEPDKQFDALSTPFTTVGQYPQVQLYPNSIENWRAYWFKYCPVRSAFDKQSQVKNWVVPEIPQVGEPKAVSEQYAAPLSWPPRWGKHQYTGYKMKPVPVLRWGVDSAPFKLACGKLKAGAYAVRIIAAVPTKDICWFRKSLFICMKVNDGLKNEVSTYLKRASYTDEFYSMCEMFFNAPHDREYTVELSVADGSEVELLVHNISLDDALAGTARRAVKTGVTMLPERSEAVLKKTAEKAQPLVTLSEERLARDEWLWQSFPQPNKQGNRPYRIPNAIKSGTDTMTWKEATQKYGTWKQVLRGSTFNKTPDNRNIFMRNNELGIVYTIDDLRNNRPLPDPYPFKDNGTGLTYQDQTDSAKGSYIAPIANVMTDYYWHYPTTIHGSVQAWEKTGNQGYAHDAALALARWAYAFPTLYTQSSYLHNLIGEFGQVGRNARFRRRMTTSAFYRWYSEYGNEELDDYDLLFPYIKGNWTLALSINRFVPWVKTPTDVIKLIDTYLVQTTAKRVLRYQWFTGEMKTAKLASVLGDTSITDPWMEWLFSKTYVYPLPIAGLPDLLVSGCTREGTEYVASSMYAGGENALPKASALQSYLKGGGNKRFDLSDPVRYPKPSAVCYWLLDRLVTGLNDIRIGDVCGPDKFYGRSFNDLDSASYWGWKWTSDPVFAFLRKHYFGKKDFTDIEWAEIEKAATTVKRAPWLDLPSRIMPQWAVVLESGRQHDDYRFRRAVALRTGMGWGHHHHDGLDLQVYMHGTMMTCDGGQRPSYSRPADRSTRMHNLVEVDGMGTGGGEWLGHSWTRTLSDADGARYTLCEATPPFSHTNVSLYQRQVALIDVDEGKGSVPLTPDQCKPRAEQNKDVVTANSYVFDVSRVSGGKRHTYAFHANLSETVTHNIVGPVAIDNAPDKDKAYIAKMAGERLAGNAPDHLTITWQLDKNQVKRDLGHGFNPKVGNHFTRLHMLGEKGARVLRGSLNCRQWSYEIPMAFVQRRSADEDAEDAKCNMESAFAAVIEPYVGVPFISDITMLTVADNGTDAKRAVAVQVKTVNGHTDICFADGRPDKVRDLQEAGTTCQVSGEFAHISTDKTGLRSATLTGGTLLAGPGIIIKPAAREYAGTITRVDYKKREFSVDTTWAPLSRTAIFEVGTGDHWTAYTATETVPEKGGTRIKVRNGADYFLSRIRDIDEESNTVYCGLSFASGAEGGAPSPGMIHNWVASNADATKFWRAEYLGGDRSTGRFGFKLTGTPATLADFGRSRKLRLWEYGVGDTARHSTSASIKRVEPAIYMLEADVHVTLALKGKALETSSDRKTWKAIKTQTVNGLVKADIPVSMLGSAGNVYLRVK